MSADVRQDLAQNMADVIDRWRPTAARELRHQDVTLAGKPVAWWFDLKNASTIDLVKALATDPTLVTPGNPNTSTFVTTSLNPGRRMGRNLAADRSTIEQWILDGAPIPSAATGLAQQTDASGFKVEPSDEPEYFHKLINIEDHPEFLNP